MRSLFSVSALSLLVAFGLIAAQPASALEKCAPLATKLKQSGVAANRALNKVFPAVKKRDTAIAKILKKQPDAIREMVELKQAALDADAAFKNCLKLLD